ncbi:exo-beta-N-acetylmuramidase NamZ family protein [Flavivirga rizhaonensis]|uniref:DUF1343 domain-containing protein n=1 Tax=Flavivirga rizhaonensis TaxID=2559571 RepID=A0A4S1DX79_9FLAO|nr:DUF1343 domain-containing protein [Flavivirga rizhaonensis]TGV02545.1 DUF1343 domain-containing protein [Flavivirga rizhaonensis]
MRFNIFKNTVLLFVFIMISCASKAKSKISLKNEISYTKKNDSVIIVGANQTDKYLSFLNGKRVGIVANQTSVIFKKEKIKVMDIDPETNERSVEHVVEKDTMTHLVDSLMSLKIDIKKVFSPEHGFRGRVDAGELVKDGIDTKTNLPIVSLYGKNKKPTKEQLEGLDVVVFDIQDVGVRFYTYISTLHYIMEACSEQGIPVLVLDRPNPNGHYVDGPTLEIKNKSFLGMHPIPLVHGMTIGEYAQMINGEKWLKNGEQCGLTVITIKNYTHDTFYSLPLRPSPNLPNDQAIKLYPSLGLFEGTNVNAGRGTEFQFQRFGAPFIDKTALIFSYTPVANFGAKYPKHKGVVCYGKDLKNEELNGFMTLKWVIEAYQNSTDKSMFFNTNNFTKHAGTDKLQKQIEAGLSETEIKATWQDALESFRETRSKYLIYD